jgi:hypothetical protein
MLPAPFEIILLFQLFLFSAWVHFLHTKADEREKALFSFFKGLVLRVEDDDTADLVLVMTGLGLAGGDHGK